jgi:hypothetical protein
MKVMSVDRAAPKMSRTSWVAIGCLALACVGLILSGYGVAALVFLAAGIVVAIARLIQAQYPLTTAEIAAHLAARHDGVTIDGHARQFGIHRTTVLAHLKRKGRSRLRSTSPETLLPAESAPEQSHDMARTAHLDSTPPIDIVDDGLTDEQIAERVAEWLHDLKQAPTVKLPVSAAEELAAARRDGDL